MHITFFLAKISAVLLLLLFLAPVPALGHLAVWAMAGACVAAVVEIALMACGVTYWIHDERVN